MKNFLEKLEKLIFYFLVFCVPLQVRHIFFVFGQEFNEWRGIYFYATDILVSALLILWGWRVFRHSGSISVIPAKAGIQDSGSRIKYGTTEVALLSFLIFSALSLFFAQNFWLGFYSLLKLIEFVLLFLYLKRNFGRFFDAQKFWLVFVFSAVLQSFWGLAQFLKQGSLGWRFFHESPLAPDISGVAKVVLDGEKLIRAYGALPHPNILAAILVAAIFGIGYLFLKNYQLSVIPAKAGIHPAVAERVKPWMTKWECGMTERKKLIVFILIFFLLIFVLFLTFSRAILVLGFFFFIFWLISLWRNQEFKKPLKILFLFFVIGYMFFITCFWPFLSARFSDLKASEQAVDLRLFLNEAAWNLLKADSILGVGQGNFVYVLSQKFPDLPAWQFQPAHNIYLLIAAETGILGLLIFLLFLFLTVKSAWQHRNDLVISCLLFVVLYLLAAGLFDHFLWDLQQGQLLLWIFLGILASLGAHSSTDRAQASGA